MATCGGTSECECEETTCPVSADGGHCECWWENEGCCRCGDPPCVVLARIQAEEDEQDQFEERLTKMFELKIMRYPDEKPEPGEHVWLVERYNAFDMVSYAFQHGKVVRIFSAVSTLYGITDVEFDEMPSAEKIKEIFEDEEVTVNEIYRIGEFTLVPGDLWFRSDDVFALLDASEKITREDVIHDL